MERDYKMYTFPSQELPCSGSTGIISAFPPLAVEHPEEKSFAKIGIQNKQHNCNFISLQPLQYKAFIMKRFYIVLVFLLSLPAIYAQNEKNIVVDANAEVRHISSFSAIEVSGAIDLYLSQGNEEAVAISASSDDIRTRIRTEVKGNTLHIYLDGKGLNWKIWGNNKMKAYVTFKSLNRVEASGACNLKATSAIKVEDLKIELSGASDFSGTVNVTRLHLEAAGASNMRINGTANKATIDASGACTMKCYDLKTDHAKIDASGASNINITVNKELNAGASGGSSIFYKGTGLIREISTSGGATIKHRAEDN